MQKIKFIKTKDVKTPSYGTSQSNGLDFYVPNDHPVITLAPHTAWNIPSGLKVQLPENYALVAFNKSGISLNSRLEVGASVVDSDYRGEIHLHVYNTSDIIQHIKPGQKLIQFLLLEAPQIQLDEVKEFDDVTQRNHGAFGSTGLK